MSLANKLFRFAQEHPENQFDVLGLLHEKKPNNTSTRWVWVGQTGHDFAPSFSNLDTPTDDSGLPESIRNTLACLPDAGNDNLKITLPPGALWEVDAEGKCIKVINI